MSDIKTKPVTAEYEAGFTRIFGDKKPVRGKFIYDGRLGKLVPIEEYQAPETEQAINAPIMADRLYENARATDGTDIGSRQKHREYMRRNNLTTTDDYTKSWAKAEKDRAELRTTGGDRKERREVIERAIYELEKNPRRKGR